MNLDTDIRLTDDTELKIVVEILQQSNYINTTCNIPSMAAMKFVNEFSSTFTKCNFMQFLATEQEFHEI